MTTLTPTERGAQALQMDEHKESRCCRCTRRLDLSVGFVCSEGEDAEKRMKSPLPCRSFRLDDDSDRWLR